jgi:hypothetical protein
MAAVALIQFTQGSHTDDAGKAVLGEYGDFSLVTITNGNNTGVVSWKIFLLDAPSSSVSFAPGSQPQILAQATSSTPTATFTPDVAGSYRVMLQVVDGLGNVDRDIRCFGIPDARGFVKPPFQDLPGPLPLALPSIISDGPFPAKPDEQNYGTNARGWAGNGTARQLDDFMGRFDDLPAMTVTSTPFTASVADLPLYVVNLNTIGGPATFNLPSAPRNGFTIRVSALGAPDSTRPLTILPQGGGSIGNSTSFVMLGDSGAALVHRGSNAWSIVGSGVTQFLSPGPNAVVRAVTDRLADTIHVLDFMTDAERTAARTPTFDVDHQPAIQRAVDWALYQNSMGFSSGRRVYLGPGRYRIDSPIHLGYGTDFRGILFEGEGKSEGGYNDAGGAGTVIVVNFSNAPGICIQGGRGTTVRGMTLIGLNAKPLEIAQGAPDMANLNTAAWVSSGLASNAGSRYAPYAAIAIDPYTGPPPTPAYPAVTYPAFLGAVAQYNKGQSRDVLIDDVTIKSFVVGVVMHPGEADGNGDFTKLSRVNFWFCQYGFSWGNSQARVNELDHCVFAYCHTCIASSVHGLQAGMPQFTATACAFETSISHFECMNLGYGGGPLFLGCFSEAMYMLGKCSGVSKDSGSIKFLGCEFGFSYWLTFGVPTWVLECEGSMQVRFENTFFYVPSLDGFLHFRTSGSALLAEPGRQLAIEGCQTNFNFDSAGLYKKAAHNATLGFTLSLGSTCLDRFSCKSGWLHNLDTGAALDVGVLHTETALAQRHVGAPVYAKRVKSLTQGNDRGVDVAWQVYGFNIDTVVSTVGRVVTITFADTNTVYLMHFGGDVGDIYVSAATGAVFVVKSRTGMQLSMEAMSGYDKDGNLLNSIVAGGLLHPINCRRYCLNAVLYGDITAASPTVTNLTLGNGGAPADLSTILTADDYLYVDQDVDRIIDPFGGAARLVSFDTGARTMTFAGNFEITQTRRRFAIFVRPAMPNA